MPQFGLSNSPFSALCPRKDWQRNRDGCSQAMDAFNNLSGTVSLNPSLAARESLDHEEDLPTSAINIESLKRNHETMTSGEAALAESSVSTLNDASQMAHNASDAREDAIEVKRRRTDDSDYDDHDLDLDALMVQLQQHTENAVMDTGNEETHDAEYSIEQQLKGALSSLSALDVDIDEQAESPILVASIVPRQADIEKTSAGGSPSADLARRSSQSESRNSTPAILLDSHDSHSTAQQQPEATGLAAELEVLPSVAAANQPKEGVQHTDGHEQIGPEASRAKSLIAQIPPLPTTHGQLPPMPPPPPALTSSSVLEQAKQPERAPERVQDSPPTLAPARERALVDQVREAVESESTRLESEIPFSRNTYILNTRQRSMGLLDALAAQILDALSCHHYQDTLTTVTHAFSERGMAYRILLDAFEDLKRMFFPSASPRAGTSSKSLALRPFLDYDIEGIERTRPNMITIQRTNLATFVAAIFGSIEIGFWELEKWFVKVFVPKGGRLLKQQANIYLNLKTQAYIAAVESSDNVELRREALDELFPEDLEQRLHEMFDQRIALSPTEMDFVERCQRRRENIEAVEPSELATKYHWVPFLREMSDYIQRNHYSLLQPRRQYFEAIPPPRQPVEVKSPPRRTSERPRPRPPLSQFPIPSAVPTATSSSNTGTGTASSSSLSLSSTSVPPPTSAPSSAAPASVSVPTPAALSDAGSPSVSPPKPEASVSEPPQSVAQISTSVASNPTHNSDAKKSPHASLSVEEGVSSTLATKHKMDTPVSLPPLPPMPPSLANKENVLKISSEGHPMFPPLPKQVLPPKSLLESSNTVPKPKEHKRPPPPVEAPGGPINTLAAYEAAKARADGTDAIRPKPSVFTTRRTWTEEEEEALLKGMDHVQGPYWAQILELYGPGGKINEVLKDRTQVQLKDKARNLKMFFVRLGVEIPRVFQYVTGDYNTRKNSGRKKQKKNLEVDAISVHSAPSALSGDAGLAPTSVARTTVDTSTNTVPHTDTSPRPDALNAPPSEQSNAVPQNSSLPEISYENSQRTSDSNGVPSSIASADRHSGAKNGAEVNQLTDSQSFQDLFAGSDVKDEDELQKLLSRVDEFVEENT